MTEDATVYLVVPDGGEITMGCRHCRQLIASTRDKFMVGLVIKGRGVVTAKYLLGVDPPIVCCGEEKVIIKTFDVEEEARAEVDRVRECLITHQSTEGLVLVSFGRHGLN